MNNGLMRRTLLKIGRESAKHIAKRARFLPAENRLVSFTFDDFPITAIENGARLLEAHKVRGTFYSSLGLAGTNSPVGTIATVHDILALSEHGHECGCHTFGHINCAESSSEVVREDCLGNQHAAKQIANLHFHSFAYPYGAFNLSSKRVISSLYRSARSIEPGINANKIDLAALKSVALSESTGLKRLKLWLGELNDSGGWLIFFSHDISQTPSEWGCSIGLFERILEESIAKNFQITTVAETMKTVRLTSRG
jgi:peptidoglycan/xylan/chitin deacetylase (PgdA/CDA1 family)